MSQTHSPSTVSLTVTKQYTLSPEEVFRAWTQPEALKRWFAPSPDFSTPLVEVDLRVGGSYRIHMKDPSGALHTVGGVYQEIQPPSRLVFTWSWEPGGPCGGNSDDPSPETLVTIEFRAISGGTELTLVHERFPTEDLRNKHHEGWTGCLQGLENAVGSLHG